MTDAQDPAPNDYRLRLDVDFANLRWKGTVEFDLPEHGPACRLDADGLTVTAARVDGRAAPYTVTRAEQELSITCAPGSSARVSIDFEGAVDTNALFGLYRSRQGSGYLLTTHCEPSGARRIFPCVDRPDRKARVHLTVRAAADLDVVANTEPVSNRVVDGSREWEFGPTPPMATYLFYFALGKFDRLEDRSGRVVVRVLTPPGRRESGRYALEAGTRILRACEEYYGVPYPLSKLDLIAVAEHAFGAMENWGAISFQETRLLVDSSSGSFAQSDVFETVAHEIAHQWFGNLVTMSWWDDIWLNESFASLMETVITDRIAPALDPWTDFFLRTAGMAQAMGGDSLRATHPIRVTVHRPEEMSQIFDEISYGKGSSVLAMLNRHLGDDRFRAGVTEYLQRFRFRNARTDDLWAALERASGEPVTSIAGPWIDRPGFPVVSARIGPKGLELEQRRFSYLGSLEEDPWPMTMVLDVDGQRQRLRWDTRTRTVPVSPTATVHLNPDGVGFYRVLYDRTLYDRLLVALPSMRASDRWVVLSDLSAFVLSGDADWSTYTRFVRALGATNDRLVVEPICSSLAGFALLYPAIAPVQEFARSYLAEAFARVGPQRRPDEPGANGVLRDRIAFARVRVDATFARELASLFPEWGRLDPDLRQSVAIARARQDGAAGYHEIRRALERPVLDSDALRLARALGWCSEPGLVREALEFAISGAVNRSHILGAVVQAAMNPAGRPVVWPWLTQRLDRLDELFRGSGYLALVLEGVLPVLGLSHPEDVRSFFRTHSYPEGTRGVVKGLEHLEVVERLGRRLAETART
ncbi:MAG TPA: M1 family metallopeptidase [Thermoplasmata archaeon]|nr:M1 family metallopeptidase [Thermoplasmata archaeon]